MGLIGKCGECGETRPLSSQDPPVCYKCAGKLNAAVASSAPIVVQDSDGLKGLLEKFGDKIASLEATVEANTLSGEVSGRIGSVQEQEKERDEVDTESEQPVDNTTDLIAVVMILVAVAVFAWVFFSDKIKVLIPKKAVPVPVVEEPMRTYL